MVFVAGYEDIVALSDLIESDENIKNGPIKPAVYTLHSQMNSLQQCRVFDKAEKGHRKVVTDGKTE